MKIKTNDILYFKENEYLVIDSIEGRYLYLINNNPTKDDIAIVKVMNNQLVKIDNEDEFDYVINKLYLDYKDEIISFFE